METKSQMPHPIHERWAGDMSHGAGRCVENRAEVATVQWQIQKLNLKSDKTMETS